MKKARFYIKFHVFLLWVLCSRQMLSAQNLPLVTISTIKTDNRKLPIKTAISFVGKAVNGAPAPDTLQIIFENNPSGKKIREKMTVGEYNQLMRKIEESVNKEGLSVYDLDTVRSPLILYKPLKRIDFASGIKSKFQSDAAVIPSRKNAEQLNILAFKTRILPGLNIKTIPAYQISRTAIADFKKAQPLRVVKMGKTYSVISTEYKHRQPSEAHAKSGSRREILPFWNSSGGENDLFEVNATGSLESLATAYPILKEIADVTLDDLKNTISSNTIRGDINTFLKINGVPVPILNISAEYTAASNKNEQHSRKIGIVIGGQVLKNAATKETYIEDDKIVTDLFEPSLKIPLMRLMIPVGIGSVRLEWGVEGSISLAVNGEMHRGLAGLQIRTIADCSMYAEGAVGIGIPGFYNFAEAYVKPSLTLVSLKLDNYAESSLNWGSRWQLYNDVSSTGSITLLKGALYTGIRVSYPDVKWCCCIPFTPASFPCGARWKELDFRVTLWDGNGLIKKDKTFIDSDPEEQFFDTW